MSCILLTKDPRHYCFRGDKIENCVFGSFPGHLFLQRTWKIPNKRRCGSAEALVISLDAGVRREGLISSWTRSGKLLAWPCEECQRPCVKVRLKSCIESVDHAPSSISSSSRHSPLNVCEDGESDTSQGHTVLTLDSGKIFITSCNLCSIFVTVIQWRSVVQLIQIKSPHSHFQLSTAVK